MSQIIHTACIAGVESWLRAPSRAILSNMSTSPLAEPPNFVPTLKQAIALVVENKVRLICWVTHLIGSNLPLT